MLSRVANSIFWMSTYLERAENVARFIRVNLQLILDLPLEFKKESHWKPLVHITGDESYFQEHFGDATMENVIQWHTFDPNYPNSILNCVQNARENARSIREIISSEMWEQINTFYQEMIHPEAKEKAFKDPFSFYKKVLLTCHLLSGITDHTMHHDQPWRYFRLGRLLERADKTSRILDVKYFLLLPKMEYVGTSIDNIQWAALLKSISAFEAYRKKYRTYSPNNVAEFLLLNRDFPRSINYCLIKAEQSLNSITGSSFGTFNYPAEQLLGKLRSRFSYITIEEIMNYGLHELLDSLQFDLNAIGSSIYESFFSPDVKKPG